MSLIPKYVHLVVVVVDAPDPEASLDAVIDDLQARDELWPADGFDPVRFVSGAYHLPEDTEDDWHVLGVEYQGQALERAQPLYP